MGHVTAPRKPPRVHKGNPHPQCPTCKRRHRPILDCLDVGRSTETLAPGAGDGVYHSAPFLKKYGA